MVQKEIQQFIQDQTQAQGTRWAAQLVHLSPETKTPFQDVVKRLSADWQHVAASLPVPPVPVAGAERDAYLAQGWESLQTAFANKVQQRLKSRTLVEFLSSASARARFLDEYVARQVLDLFVQDTRASQKASEDFNRDLRAALPEKAKIDPGNMLRAASRPAKFWRMIGTMAVQRELNKQARLLNLDVQDDPGRLDQRHW
jgi:hypothetical protein